MQALACYNKIMKLKNYRQKRPPHIYLDNQIYFITARCNRGIHFLRPDKYKQILVDCIFEQVKKFSYKLYGWVINQNHYYLLIKTKTGSDLPKFIGAINGKSSKLINDSDDVIGQKIWSNYFDKCIRTEEDFYKHLNYIHQNPIKHGLIPDMQALACFSYCSYKQYLKTKGKDWLGDCFSKYPIIDFVAFGDEI